MIEDGRPCRDVIQQVAAAGKALDRLGVSLLVSSSSTAWRTPRRPGSRATTRAEVERLFMSLT